MLDLWRALAMADSNGSPSGIPLGCADVSSTALVAQ